LHLAQLTFGRDSIAAFEQRHRPSVGSMKFNPVPLVLHDAAEPTRFGCLPACRPHLLNACSIFQ
jgi:hypothetical protein